MKRRLFYIIISLLIISCSKKQDTIAIEALQSVYDNGMEASLSYFNLDEGQRQTIKALAPNFDLQTCEKAKSHGGVKSIKVVESKIQEETGNAIVKLETTFADGTTDHANLVLVSTSDGEWKIKM